MREKDKNTYEMRIIITCVGFTFKVHKGPANNFFRPADEERNSEN